MQRDILLITEMIDAADQAQRLVDGVTINQLEADRQRRDALLWNFTVLGEAGAPRSCCHGAASGVTFRQRTANG